MHINQTPFEYIQRRGRERKSNIMNSIEQKDLKRRSISYNFKANNDNNYDNAQLDENIENKEHLSHIAINNTIKKAYYYRKLMNKSIDSHITTDEFQRVKEKFDKIHNKDPSNQNKSNLFRQIWQREQFKKYSADFPKEQQNYLEVVSKNSQKYKTLSLQPENHTKKKEQAPKSILDIASERRTTLNFDLQILGNKKSIRIKDSHNKVKINTIPNIKTISGEQKDSNQMMSQSESNSPIIEREQKNDEKETKGICTFFKRFQQENSQQKIDHHNEFLQITKLNQSIFPITNNYELENIKLKKLKLRQYQSELQQAQATVIRRQIQSSWRPTTRASSQKNNRLQISHQRRTAILKSKRTQIPKFINDIKGWMVQQDNDQELLSNLQQ